MEYVFAVAAYSANGELIGGSIGATGTPILASYTYPPLAAWGELCKVKEREFIGVKFNVRMNYPVCILNICTNQDSDGTYCARIISLWMMLYNSSTIQKMNNLLYGIRSCVMYISL